MTFFNTRHPALNLALERAYCQRGSDGQGSLRELSDAIDAVVVLLDDATRASHGQAPAQAAPELTGTTVTAKNPAAPVSSFEDSRTQAVYEVLVNDNYPPAGSNEHWEGWKARLIVDALFPMAAPAAVAGPVAFTAEHVTYIRRYGGSCRDCADENGVCPNRGLPCADSEKAIRFVLEALAYGINHGYIAAPTTQPAPQTLPASQGDALDAAHKGRCQHCIDRHDGVYGSWAAPCPYHDDDGNPRIDTARTAQDGK